MSSDLEHVVAEIPRPDGGALRIVRKTYNGSAPFTQLARLFRDEQSGELRFTRSVVTVRDADLPAVVDALQRIARKLGAPATERRTPAHRQPTLPLAPRTTQSEASDAALKMIDEVF